MSALENGNRRAEGIAAPSSVLGKTVETDPIMNGENTSQAVPASHDPRALIAHAKASHDLIPVDGKMPAASGWRRSEPLSLAEAKARMARGGNIGVRLRETDLVIDVDPRHFRENDDPLGRLKADFGLPDAPFVRTGGGGLHLYIRKPSDISIVNGLPEYPGIEFKSHGRQVVSAGSVHPETGKPYRLADDALALSLSEILSPSPELRDHILRFKRLAQLYAAVRNAYADKVGFVVDLAYKTKRLVEQGAEQSGLGTLTKSVTFDVKTLEALRGEKGPDEGKVFNLVRGLQKEIDEDANAAPVLQPLKDRVERILKDMESRKTTGLAAMDLLAALAAEKDAAAQAAKETGLSPKAFGMFWALKDDDPLKTAGIQPLDIAREAEKLMARFPNAPVNADEQRQLRAALYRPLLAVKPEARSKIVDLIVEIAVR